MTAAVIEQQNINELWHKCVEQLQREFPPQQFSTWIRPLQLKSENGKLCLVAPNKFVGDWVQQNFLYRINSLIQEYSNGGFDEVLLQTAGQAAVATTGAIKSTFAPAIAATPALSTVVREPTKPLTVTSNDTAAKQPEHKQTNLNTAFTFENFVEGNSNQLARAASTQVGENPGEAYNPLFIYGGVGLGKTHLMHAVGNLILVNNPNANVLYLHSERFVADMVRALQSNAINEFKRFYRSLNVLLIDDIQFFAGKDRSQEEFFHTFNALLEGQQQIILTSDRYPKEIEGVEERLKSRFGWGLTVAVEPPELETRVAILMRKAEQSRIELPYEVAFFIAKRIRSNVRELEGALRRVIANAQFTGKPITLDFVHDALRDLLALQDKLVTVENIIKTVAEYYKIKVADILSKRRNRSVTRPRQMAMSLAKELTNHSLPEIGDAFGGRDHTTVIHACRKIKDLLLSNQDLAEDHKNLMRILTT